MRRPQSKLCALVTLDGVIALSFRIQLDLVNPRTEILDQGLVGGGYCPHTSDIRCRHAPQQQNASIYLSRYRIKSLKKFDENITWAG